MTFMVKKCKDKQYATKGGSSIRHRKFQYQQWDVLRGMCVARALELKSNYLLYRRRKNVSFEIKYKTLCSCNASTYQHFYVK